VTIGLPFAIKGVGSRAFYHWLNRDFGHWFPILPDRTQLFRRLKTHWKWVQSQSVGGARDLQPSLD